MPRDSAIAGINRTRSPAWGEQVRDLTNGQGAHLMIDVGGAETLTHAADALHMGGHVAVVGYVSGPEIRLDLRPLFIGRRARVHGHTVGSRKQFEAMNRAIEAHGLNPVIDSRFGLEDLASAYVRVRSGEAFGKVLVTL